jgi:tetratricopeptide (TPR) repeat protein
MLRNRTERRLLPLLLAFTLSTALSLWAQKAAPAARPPAWQTTANTQLDHGDLESAERTLWSVLGSEPTNERALTMLGVIRGRQNRYPEAEALFRRVLQLNPKSMVATINLAGALLAQDKPEDAIQQYDQAIQLNPQNSELRIEVAKLQLARGNFAGALAALDAIKSSPFPPPAIALKAASLLGMGRRADAEAMIPKAQRSPKAALELAQVFVDATESDGALRALSLINPVPKPLAGRVYYLQGRALAQEGNAPAAQASFRQALAADPKSIETLLAMAQMFALEKKHADSMAMLQKARTLSPDSREVLRHFIVEAMQAGQNDKALQAAQELQAKSSEPADQYLVASVMVQQKQYLSASHILEDYVAQHPEDARAYLGLGIAYLNLLRYPEARQALERSLQLKPDLAEAEFQSGLLASQEGRRQDTLRHWQRAVELQPQHAQALFSLGTVYLEAGQLAEAETAFTRSLASDPGNMKTEYNLALVLNKLGKSEEAKQHLEHYRRMQEAEHATSGNPPRASERQ